MVWKFCLVDNLLFLKNANGNHKRVIVEGIMAAIKLEVQTLHRQKHYEHNRFYGLCKQLYFFIPKPLVRGFVQNPIFVHKHNL